MAMPAKRPKYEAKDLATKVKKLRPLKDRLSQKEVMMRHNVKRSTLSTYVSATGSEKLCPRKLLLENRQAYMFTFCSKGMLKKLVCLLCSF